MERSKLEQKEFMKSYETAEHGISEGKSPPRNQQNKCRKTHNYMTFLWNFSTSGMKVRS